MASLVVAADATQPAALTKPPAVNDKAPDFTLQTLDAKDVKLGELLKSGPVVVIELRGWVGYQCPICNVQVNDLIAHAKDFTAAKAQVVLIYPGPTDKLQEHAKEFVTGKTLPENFSFVTDPDMKFVINWGLRWAKTAETAYPSTFVIDKEGVIRYTKVSTTHGGRASSADILKALEPLK